MAAESSADGPRPPEPSDERVAPAEGMSAAFHERQAEREAQRLAARFDPAIQFSLRDLFAVVTLMSIELAGLHWLSAKHFAGLAGMAALVWLICLTQLRFPSPLGQMIWWTLFAVYLLSMVFTLVPRGG